MEEYNSKGDPMYHLFKYMMLMRLKKKEKKKKESWT